MRAYAVSNTLCKLFLITLAVPVAGAAATAAYPERPIRLIVPLAANGAMDTVARSMAPRGSAPPPRH